MKSVDRFGTAYQLMSPPLRPC